MAKVNTHGLKMTGLKYASGQTKYEMGWYTQISYDLSDGMVIADRNQQNTWEQYHSPTIISIAKPREHMTMQEIADAVYERIVERQLLEDAIRTTSDL